MKLIFENAPQPLLDDVQAVSAEILKSTSVTGVDFQYDNVSAESRWTQLVMAAQGTRLWSNRPNPHSPLYAGKLPKNDREIELIMRDLEFARMRAEVVAEYNVCYIGRTYVQPRNLLVIDHKKAGERQNVALSEPLRDLLTAAPFDWWGSLGIVSSGSPDRLVDFLDAHPDVVPLTYSTGGMAKLKYAGREFVHLGTPKPTSDYGIDMRVRSNALFNKPIDPPRGDR